MVIETFLGLSNKPPVEAAFSLRLLSVLYIVRLMEITSRIQYALKCFEIGHLYRRAEQLLEVLQIINGRNASG